MTSYFVSDLHLVSEDEEKTHVFLRFLDDLLKKVKTNAPDQPSHLFLVGDIFDLWIGSHEYFLKRFPQTVDCVQKLVQAKVAVHFFEGNHDLHLKSFWGDKLGVTVHGDAAYFDLDAKIVRVEHGDLINPDDRGYLFLRKALRSLPMTFLALHLPSVLVSAIGERASRASRIYTSASPRKALPTEAIQKLIRRHAQKVFEDSPFDLIITGHVHVKDEFTFRAKGREALSVNLGSWYDVPKAYKLGRGKSEFISLS